MNDWFEAEQRVERAHEMYQTGRWEEALRELRAALRVNPAQPEWHFNMGMTLEAMGRHTEAAGSYRNALEHHGQDPDILNHLGAALLRAGRPLEAMEALEQAEKLDPADEASYVYRIDAYRQLGDHDNAEVMFYTACQINEENPRTYILMAQSLLDRGIADRAIATLRRVRDLDSGDPDLHAHLGEAYRIKGDLDRALEEYTVQVGLHPKDTVAMLELARILADLHRPVEAAAKLRRVIELEPACAEAHFDMGCLALDADHPDAAKVAFETALKVDPSHAGAHQNLARIALRRGRFQDAQKHLAAEMALLAAEIPADRPGIEDLARLLVDAEMHGQAIDLLNELTRHDPQDAELWHQLAAACFLSGRLDEGVSFARRAVRIDRRHLPAVQNLIYAYLGRRQLAHARYWLARAEAIDADDPLTRQLRGKFFAHALRRWMRRFFLR